jgi:hypothetical protein
MPPIVFLGALAVSLAVLTAIGLRGFARRTIG